MAKKKGIAENKKNKKPVETVEAAAEVSSVEEVPAEENAAEVSSVEEVTAEENVAEDTESAEESASEEYHSETVEMDPGDVMSAIESILFALGESVSLDKLAEVIEISKGQVEDAVDALAEKYEAPECGLSIVRLEDNVQLCTKAENYDYLVRVTKAKPKFSLSDTVLETLSIIAYKQPVTKIEIEKIRGVSCDHAVNKLLEYDLIREFGRLDAPGKPILFGTTENFLRCFGVTSISDLPQITPDQVEEYKKEAEAEINVKLDI